jgi:hypothetical protein
MGIGRDEGAMILAFCTMSSRGIQSIQIKRCMVVLSQDGINRQIVDEGVAQNSYRRANGSIPELARALLNNRLFSTPHMRERQI